MVKPETTDSWESSKRKMQNEQRIMHRKSTKEGVGLPVRRRRNAFFCLFDVPHPLQMRYATDLLVDFIDTCSQNVFSPKTSGRYVVEFYTKLAIDLFVKIKI